ncbi:MAG TPA: ABC transporter permease [Bryobacteraceae bacterium]|nr:ABC transporter permease [Bryobacteraceae bacterium]
MNWFERLVRRKRIEEQLENELRFHLDQHVAELMAQGHDAEGARRLARLALGGPEQVKEQCRDARGTRWLADFFGDARYALRGLRQRPGFAAVSLLTLALGTGATTVMFTVINSVVLKPLPYFHPESLMQVWEQTNWSTQRGNRWALTYPNYLDCKREARSLDMAAFHYGGGILSAPGDAEYTEAYEISSELFSVLGVHLFRGRAFLPEEDRPGGAPVAIISHDLWQRRFGGNPAAIGMTIVYDGQPRTVTGITAPNFRLDDEEIDVFTPLGQDTSPLQTNREAHGTAAWARLLPGATVAQANRELAVIGRQLEAEFPKSNQGRTFIAEPLRPDVGDVRSTLWLLLAAVGLVLLIACANIASLLLARTVSRERELAMRAALGASQGRLVRQSLTESAVLGLSGGALGILLAVAGNRPFVAFWPGNLPRSEEVRLDGRVLLFTLCVSLASSFLFGLAPSVRTRVRDLERALRSGARTITGSSRRMQGAFVAGEIAIAAVLLVSAGMLGRTMLRLSSLNPGLDIRNVLIARVALSPATLADPGRTRAAWQDILDRARRVPGVEAIATIDTVPMREGSNQIPYSTTAAIPPDNRAPLVLANSASPDYLKVTRIPLLEGRFLTDEDRLGGESVAVIDEVMAQQAFPGEDPIGKHVWLRIALGRAPAPATVVGVAGHVRQWGLAGDDHARVRAQLYYPFAQVPDSNLRRWSELMSIAVRTDGDPRAALERLRREVRGATNDQVLYQVRTMEQLSSNSVARQRFLLLLFGVFAGLALVLASTGIYGVLAYLTSQRVPEIGVRMALGASAGEVVFLVLQQSLAMIFAGVALGVAGAMGAGLVLTRLIEGVGSAEPSTIALTVSLLAAAALIASYLPARRASRVDPVNALRQD